MKCFRFFNKGRLGGRVDEIIAWAKGRQSGDAEITQLLVTSTRQKGWWKRKFKEEGINNISVVCMGERGR